MGLADLSSVLWRERDLLELLLFKLDEERLLLAAGRTRWVAHATAEVDIVLRQLRQTEVLRAAEVVAVAAAFDLPGDASLAQLADRVDDPWSGLLREHRDAFLTLTAEINALAEANQEMLTTGLRAVRETMLTVPGGTETYGRRGEAVAVMAQGQLIDKAS
ncbi:MAG: flagellar biosynthesis protein FlgN [Actinobacteria bacterium 13_2_20CM_2_71_6]|nr:MAG: flagellar biosynthesis protein FlgN [Actinobacteria bacterium 13_2_20CM_2_71_6]TML31550.1 MAG: flagellar protein FlgN [Actinomycetota bacterium]